MRKETPIPIPGAGEGEESVDLERAQSEEIWQNGQLFLIHQDGPIITVIGSKPEEEDS